MDSSKNKLKQCAACDSTISKRAAVCPRCGEPQGITKKQYKSVEGNKILSIFDFKFTKLITPSLVKLIYALVVVLGALYTVTAIISFFTSRPSQLSELITGFLGYIAIILVVRTYCEVALILFKIEENTSR